MNSNEKGNIGEDFVNTIAFNSFLELWCYPSPKDENGDKKEICDLLIIFKDTLIIISVKNYEFKDLYSRYFRKTIDKAVKQIYGAERKLFTIDKDVFIKHPNKQVERFPKEKIKNTYRIIVNLGEGVRFYPFNKKTIDEKFITLFDKEAYETLLHELDTISDFIEYLKKREQFFYNKTVTIMPGKEDDFPTEAANQFFEYVQEKINPNEKKGILISGTEHDLLGHYLKNNRSFLRSLESKEFDGMFVQLDGNWEEYKSKKQVIRKKELDVKSFFLDELVKREVLCNIDEYSIELATEIMSFNRFSRRVISKSFLEFFDTYKHKKGQFLGRRYGDFDGTGIVFAFYNQDMPVDMVNDLLELTLDSFSIHSNYKSSKMILIATTNEFKQFKMCLIKDIKPFPKEEENQIMESVKKLGWFTNYTEINFSEKEYPDEE